MTGVTAMTRATADKMETKGISYPGEEVKETFLAADLLHISNEIPFNPDCPTPDPYTESLRMCSDPKYIGLLEEIGTDIVELTGNHFQDFGSEATLFTLNMYDERGWEYFGGGRNQEEAKRPTLITHNGNRLAFIGCNPAGPDFAWATDGSPGAAWCDYDYMTGEITRLRGEGYLPIVTFQHYESYHLDPVLEQMGDFQTMADAGAVIVSGSQSHVPQYMEFSGDTLLHYGLGNLFFDQMFNSIAGTDTRKEFVDRHVFYNGQYISTELLTYMLEDYARPREMENWEREELLLDVFGEYGLLR
jgi:poly-gamma-glutamate synthesis protein (capsule biosynthesis protein)